MKKAHENSHHRYAENNPAFPARRFTTYSALSPAIGLFVTVPAQREALSRVRASVEALRPRGFVVRTLAHSSLHQGASIASRTQRFVTIAKRPSDRARDARKGARDLPVVTSASACDTLARRAKSPRVRGKGVKGSSAGWVERFAKPIRHWLMDIASLHPSQHSEEAAGRQRGLIVEPQVREAGHSLPAAIKRRYSSPDAAPHRLQRSQALQVAVTKNRKIRHAAIQPSR